MNFPEELKYSKDHEWIRVEGNVAYVGITDFAQCELGEIVYVDVTSEGESFMQEDVFGTIEAVKTVSDLLIPASGKIIEFNLDLDAKPELVNTDPYGKGWIVKIEPSNLLELDALMSVSEYKALIGK